MREPILRLEGVETHIGPYHILHGVGFDVPAGELTLLLGRNGAGKTTTLRTVMGLWQASAGRILFEGRDISKSATPDIARAGIAYVPEAMGVFGQLTVRENLVLAARQGPIDTARLAETEDNPVLAVRWWPLDELERTDDVIEPRGLVALARRIARGEAPPSPVDLA